MARRVQQLDTKIGKKKRALETLEANHKEVSEAFLRFQTLLQDTSKRLHDAKTELGQLHAERSVVVLGGSSSGSQS